MSLEYMLTLLRDAGWMAAAHNDSIHDNVFHTFWLFTHQSGRFLKGEGRTDHEAVSLILAQARIPIPTTNLGILDDYDAIWLKVREALSR